MNINYILYLLIFFIFIYSVFKKYEILQENINYSEHKRLGKSNKAPILIGGVFIVISLLIFLPQNLLFFKITTILIFLVGILSDKNIISSPKLRLFFQISVIFFLVHFEKLNIIGIQVNFIDYLLTIDYFNYFFTIFCFAVLVNGSNFVDGLNGLLSGYFILVLSSIYFVTNYHINVSNDIKMIIDLLLTVTIIFYLFNLFGIVYLGDSGSYLLSISIGFVLVKIYQDTKVIRLEQNYRSTENILTVASSLISNNQNRVGKLLKSTMEAGDLIQLNCFKNGKDEAIGVSDEIEKIKKDFSLNNVAILVRAIFQTREFEERFLKIGLPYRILGGIKFYERTEIKDCVAYLRLIYQDRDDLAFERIVNNPKRSIGESTIKLIHEFSKTSKLSLESSSRKMIEKNLIKPKTKIGLNLFLDLISKWRNDLKIKEINHVKLLQIVLDESGYSAMLKNKKDLENENRLENIKELLSAMKEFDNLESFLDHVSLATSIDQDWEGEKINMMTMHAAKGLEFDVVFLPGWEEGLFPHQKSIEEKGHNGLEEERRLAYVGITRAKKNAIISFSMNRFYQGDWVDSMASRFIEELPEDNLEKNSFFEDNTNTFDEFEFNQDIELDDDPKRSPGWIRYQKRIK